MNNGNFIHIAGWMVNELGLKGNELLIFAIVYGFTQAAAQKFTGSAQYFADWLKCTRQGATKNLQSLIEKGYIVKGEIEQDGITKVYYQVSSDVNKVYTGMSTKFTGDVNKVDNPCQQSLHDTLSNNYINNNIINNRGFRPPTLDEVRAYCEERKNDIDPEAFIDHYTGNGWKVGKNPMKDWKAAVRQWERNEFSSGRKPKQQQMANKSFDTADLEALFASDLEDIVKDGEKNGV